MTSSIIGISNNQKIELPKSSRLQGLYVIGATGTGKSGLLENLIVQDINQNIGVCVLDPHGDLIDKILSRIEAKDEDRIIYLDCLQKNHAFGLNIYHCPDPKDGEAVLRTFEQVEHVFELFWGRDIEIATRPDLSQAIRNTAYSFIYNSNTQYTGCGLVEIPLLFEEDIPRANIATVLEKRNDRLYSFWKRYDYISPLRREQFSQMLISRSERFILNDVVRYIVGQGRTTINFREVMDKSQVLLVKLPGKYEDTTELLGSMIIAEVLTAALSRQDIPINKRRQFNIYADEFQKFASSDFSKLLTECRKYGQAVTIAHQARDFIDLKNKAAALQAANIAVFRIISKDAHELASNFDCTPPPAETRRQEILEPIRDVVSHLFHVGNPNQAIEFFIKGILKPIYEATNEEVRIKDKVPYDLGRTTKIQLLDMLNTLFYEVMVTHNPRKVVPTKLFHALAKVGSLVYGFPMIFMMVEKNLVRFEGMSQVTFQPYEFWSEKSELKVLLDSLWVDPELNILTPDSLGRSKIFEEISYIFLKNHTDEHMPKFDTKLNYTDDEFKEAFTRELEKIDRTQFWDQLNKFGLFLSIILYTMDGLAKEPITSGSGLYEQIPVHEMTYADVANQIANQLSRLEKHTAKMRIHGVSNTLEEYLIETEKPGNGISEKTLEERKQRILKNMLAKGIYRSKAEIDTEIRNRHVKLRTALQKPVEQKPTEQVQKKPETQQPKRLRRIESDIEEKQPAQPVSSYEALKKQELVLVGQKLYQIYRDDLRLIPGSVSLSYKEWEQKELEKARELDAL
jgi:hypothetical protein